jgi:hypothetical protein
MQVLANSVVALSVIIAAVAIVAMVFRCEFRSKFGTTNVEIHIKPNIASCESSGRKAVKNRK